MKQNPINIKKEGGYQNGFYKAVVLVDQIRRVEWVDAEKPEKVDLDKGWDLIRHEDGFWYY